MNFEMHTPWWVSGHAADGSYANVCALVPADTEQQAWDYVRDCHDDFGVDLSEVRFCELQTRRRKTSTPANPVNDETPIEGTEWPLGGDRFQRSDWMVWRDNMPKFKTLRLKTRALIYQAMKAAGHWYIVDICQWPHDRENLPGIHAITLDGAPFMKFQVLGNGWLRIVRLRDNPWLRWTEMGLVPGRCLPVDLLIGLIEKHPHKADIPTAQGISLAECKKILKEKDARKTQNS